MAKRLRGRGWRSDFSLPHPQTGAPIRYRRFLGASVRNKREADVAERRLMVEMEKRHAAAQESLTSPGGADVSAPFSGLAARWLQHQAVKLKPKTYQLYESLCRVWLLPHFGDRQVRSIGVYDVEALQAYMARTKGRRGTPPAPKTINEAVGCLSSMLSSAKRWGYITRNVCEDVEKLGVPISDLRFYDAEETAVWLAKCQALEPQWHAFFLAGFRTGMREGELFALHVEDVDFGRSQIHVRRTYGAAAVPDPESGDTIRPAITTYMTGTPKSGRGRFVGLTPQLAEALRDWIGTRRSGLVWSVRPRDDGDTHLRRSQALRPWKLVSAAADLPELTLHAMRHSFASQLVMKGVPLVSVQALLGHSSIKMTQRYAHLSPGYASREIGVLDAPGGTLAGTREADRVSDRPSTEGRLVGVTGFEPMQTVIRFDAEKRRNLG